MTYFCVAWTLNLSSFNQSITQSINQSMHRLVCKHMTRWRHTSNATRRRQMPPRQTHLWPIPLAASAHVQRDPSPTLE